MFISSLAASVRKALSIRNSHILVMLISLTLLGGCRSSGELGSEPEHLIDRSRTSFQSMMIDRQYPGLVDLASRARAIIIAPSVQRSAVFIGARAGNAVMLVRNDAGQWSAPAFYTVGGISFGFQLGGQTSEVVIAVMTEKGMKAIMEHQVTLGGDAGVAVGEVGKGVNAATALDLKADMYSFARSEGLFAGVSLEGSVIAPRETWNHNVYGNTATPRSILIDRTTNSNSPAVAAIIAAMP